MRIKINDNESYEIGMNEGEIITLADLTDLVERLNNAFPSERTMTFHGKGHTVVEPRISPLPKLSEQSKERYGQNKGKKYKHSKEFLEKGYGKTTKKSYYKKKGKIKHPKGSISYRKNRDETINMMKVNYFGDEKEKENYAKNIGIDWQEIAKDIWRLRNKFKITPQEVGLDKFPTRGKAVKFIKNLQSSQNGKKKDEILDEVKYY